MCRYVTDGARVSRIGVATRTSSLEALVDADLDTLVTALYVKIDDGLVKDRRPGHPARLSQSELVCLAVVQALLGFRSEHRWIRYALCHLRGAFPYLPHQPGYNKRLRAALPLIKQTIRDLAADSDFWFDNVWIADSTPVECAAHAPQSSARTWPAGQTTASGWLCSATAAPDALAVSRIRWSAWPAFTQSAGRSAAVSNPATPTARAHVAVPSGGLPQPWPWAKSRPGKYGSVCSARAG
jgi:hypothetical protein